LAGTYPFGTFLIDPVTGNPQQFIGITIGQVTNVTISAGELELTVSLTDDTHDYAEGTSFQLYGLTGANNLWLNGYTITLSSKYDHTLLGRKFVGVTSHADYSAAEAGQAFIIQTGTTPVIAQSLGTVPTYGTVKPAAANEFLGSLTLDGNTVWINRGVDYGDGNQAAVENWGIKAPITAPTFAATGSAVSHGRRIRITLLSLSSSIRFTETCGRLRQRACSARIQPTFGLACPSLAERSSSVRSIQTMDVNIFFHDGHSVSSISCRRHGRPQKHVYLRPRKRKLSESERRPAHSECDRVDDNCVSSSVHSECHRHDS
jgi:hypothetical protein